MFRAILVKLEAGAVALDRAVGRRTLYALLAVAAGLALLSGLTGIREFDQWHHMAWGRAFLREGFPQHDFFLFTYLDRPAPEAPEWLGSVGIYLAWLVGGEAGTVVLVGLLFGATAAVMIWDGLDGSEHRWVDLLVVLVVTGLALGVMRRRAVVRPEIFCYPLLAWTLLAARRWVEGRGRAILAFPAVALLWTNLHVTVLYGLGAVFAYAALALFQAWRRGLGAPERRRAWTLVGVAVAGTLLSLVQPGGSPVFLGLRYGLGLLGIRVGPPVEADQEAALELMHGLILELQPPDPEAYYTALGGLLVVFALGPLVAWRRTDLASLFLSAVALVFGLKAQRFLPLFAVIVAAGTARNLREGLDRLHGRWRLPNLLIVPLVPLAAAWSPIVDPQPFTVEPAPEIFPVKAAQVLRDAGADRIPGLRIYETFHLGGYLEWVLDAPIHYNDGRLLWPLGDARTAIQVGGAPDINRLDARWNFDALVLQNLRFDDKASRLSIQKLIFDMNADRRVFALVALDDGAQLYVRRDGKLAHLLAREYRMLSPGRAVTREELEDPFYVVRTRAEWSRAVAENPGCLYCKAGLYLAHLSAGDVQAARLLFPDGHVPPTTHPLGNGSLGAVMEGLQTLGHQRTIEGMERFRTRDFAGAARLLEIGALAYDTPSVRISYGRALQARGDVGGAEAQYRSALAMKADDLEASFMLAEVLAATGRRSEAGKLYGVCVERDPAGKIGRVARQRLETLGP